MGTSREPGVCPRGEARGPPARSSSRIGSGFTIGLSGKSGTLTRRDESAGSSCHPGLVPRRGLAVELFAEGEADGLGAAVEPEVEPAGVGPAGQEAPAGLGV